jgi:hypothetical protein
MARAIPVTVDATVLDIAGSMTKLMGWSVRETAGAATGTFDILEGGSGGPVVASVVVDTSGSSTEWFGPQGIDVNGDIYFDKIGTGTIRGCIFVA